MTGWGDEITAAEEVAAGAAAEAEGAYECEYEGLSGVRDGLCARDDSAEEELAAATGVAVDAAVLPASDCPSSS